MEVMKTEMSGADDRVIATRAIDTDWNAVAPANIVKLVNTCADGLGTSKEAFFFPLLTATAAMLGHNAYIALNDLWSEPPVIWTAVLADDMCRKKSAVVRFITRSMKEAEDQIRNEHAQRVFTSPDTNITDPLKAVLHNTSEFDFTMSNLKERMTSGGRQACIIAKDLQRVYRALDAPRSSGSDAQVCQKEEEEVLKHREAFFELQTGYSPWSDVTGAVYEDARFNLSGE